MRKEDLWLNALMVMLRKEGVYNARLCCAPCEVNLSIAHLYCIPRSCNAQAHVTHEEICLPNIVHGIHTHCWSKSLSKMSCSPQPTTLLRLLRQTNVMHELLSLWKLGHKVISTPGQKWLLMHLNENKQQVVSENKITPTFRGNSVYYTIRVCALQTGQRATTLVSAGHFWTMQSKLAMWFHGVIVSKKSDRFCKCTQQRKSCALERFHFKTQFQRFAFSYPVIAWTRVQKATVSVCHIEDAAV